VPEYHVDESGPDHQKSFRAVVRVGGRGYGSGEGRSKKEAEQQAAERAWRAISNGETGQDLAGAGEPAPASGRYRPGQYGAHGPAGNGTEPASHEARAAETGVAETGAAGAEPGGHR
jgi:ribonuclease-3